MILGTDWLENVAEEEVVFHFGNVNRPTHGPGYKPGVSYMGHNIHLSRIEELPKDLNEFFEYPVLGSQTVSRLAINRFTRQLAVVFCDSPAVHIFAPLSAELEKRIEDRDSRDEVLAQVKATCQSSVAESFPDAALWDVDNFMKRG